MSPEIRYHVGDLVRTNGNVKPPKFAQKQGTVAAVHRSKTSVEIGLDFGGPEATSQLRCEAWFLPGQLEPIIAETSRPHTTRKKEQ